MIYATTLPRVDLSSSKVLNISLNQVFRICRNNSVERVTDFGSNNLTVASSIPLKATIFHPRS